MDSEKQTAHIQFNYTNGKSVHYAHDILKTAMIRKYKQDDAKSVKFIAHTEEQQGTMRGVCSLRCDYYIDNEPEHCFVMTDEFDKPAGYVLCSIDRVKYESLFPTYLSSAKSEDKKLYRSVKRLHKKLNAVPAEYPARMEINILPAFQGKGGAKALVLALIAHLKQIGVSGLYAVTDSPSALAFCERLGFQRVLHISKTINVYGIKL